MQLEIKISLENFELKVEESLKRWTKREGKSEIQDKKIRGVHCRQFYMSLTFLYILRAEALTGFLKIIYFCLLVYGCAGSSLLHMGFLQLQRVGCNYSLLWCTGFSLCWLLLLWSTVVVVVCGLSSCSSWALEQGLRGCGVWA